MTPVCPPASPLPFAIHRARYHSAVARVYAVAELAETMPGVDPRHVFDFRDGLRLVVSREDLRPSPGIVVHVSASAIPGSALYRAISCGRLDYVNFCRLVLDRFRAISGETGPYRLDVSSGMGVPHFYFPEPDE